ncbi:hypothetical protein ACWEQ4_05650 [Rhodococcus sp. NPDC003994]
MTALACGAATTEPVITAADSAKPAARRLNLAARIAFPQLFDWPMTTSNFAVRVGAIHRSVDIAGPEEVRGPGISG